MTRARYSHLVGILGSSNAGKTCLLTSLYLQACHGLLRPEFRFAGSLTLQGFELRARKLRTWTNGSMPDQFADHTVLADPRSPAFVHMALDRPGRPGGQGRVELLLADLPGEWSSQLINQASTAKRFDFLARADALVIVVEGPRLAFDSTRHAELMNLRHLLRRLADDVGVDAHAPLVLVASKCDELNMIVPPALAEAEGYARDLGFFPAIVPTASFSRRPERVPNGQGVIDVVHAILKGLPPILEQTPPLQIQKPFRSFWQHRDW
ncbi:TRAFAC clade GTPase domain-containing protein [Singulisphaera sp. GP187]|uniref:TRAFAC clade GTPase domain-containing protein n=1 Tax=Singulisphaera sp. GP187 TaxID=1882752 RepID=UPI0011613DB6|nr:GTPase domain-containing protein [Singulisphaera sp. GP187]